MEITTTHSSGREGEEKREERAWGRAGPKCRDATPVAEWECGQPTMQLQPYQTVTPSLMSGNAGNSSPDGGRRRLRDRGKAERERERRASEKGRGSNKEPSTCCCLMTHLRVVTWGEWIRRTGAAKAAVAARLTPPSSRWKAPMRSNSNRDTFVRNAARLDTIWAKIRAKIKLVQLFFMIIYEIWILPSRDILALIILSAFHLN